MPSTITITLNFVLNPEIYYSTVLIKLVSYSLTIENQYACLNELYAYDTYCPSDFQRITRGLRQEENFDKEYMTPVFLRKANKQRNSLCILL